MLDLFILVGVVNALLLGLAALGGTMRDHRWGWLAALWFLLVVIISAIFVQHRTEGRIEALAVAIEQAAWLSGPLLFHFVAAAVGRPVEWRSTLLHFSAPMLIVAIGTPLIFWAGYEPISPVLLVLFQAGYTIASLAFFLRWRNRQSWRLLEFWMPIGALGLMVAIHFGQLARLSAVGSSYVDAVPAVAAVVVLLLLLAVVIFSHVLPILPDARTKYARSRLDGDDARAIVIRVREELATRGLFRQHDLTLADVAATLALTSHRLSQAISEGGGTSFAALLADARIEEAKRLLLEPRNTRIAVEPIGMEAGFRSRSVFYANFKKKTGLTPAEYRERGGTIVSGPMGVDTA